QKCSSDYQRRYRSRDHAKTWLDAQSYCRDNHTDLISGVKQLKDFKKQYPNDVNQIFWIGLFRDCWSWSDGSSFSFRLWEQDPKKTCAALKIEQQIHFKVQFSAEILLSTAAYHSFFCLLKGCSELHFKVRKKMKKIEESLKHR
uniref:C-type lectin domain-containing protein n=1 Tax=Sander lucioperca TaxID=283035 RepID=A0A8C9XC64_SANLU